MIRLRSVVALLVVALLVASGAVAAQSTPFALTAPIRSFEVVARHPHDVAAFTEGLIYLDGQLYEGTGMTGDSQLRLVDLESGKVLKSVDLHSSEFGEGVTVLGDRIYQLTWKAEIAHVYDLATFEEIGTRSYEGQGWGLTTDGTSLIMSNGSDQIVFRDPDTFEISRTISVRDGDMAISQLNELEYVEGVIWANVWMTNLIARIDAETGEVIDWLDLSSLDAEVRAAIPNVDVLNGIAWNPDAGTMLVTGKYWPTLFEIKLLPA